MTERTIKQRWKAVWVDREKFARALFDTAVGNVYGEEIEDKLYESLGDSYFGYADTLLPLIEKAVREARKAEARLWLGMTCNEEADARIAELEAGE